MLYKYYQQHIFPHVLNQVMQVPSLMDKRRELLLPIQGEVLEIGFGTGLNLQRRFVFDRRVRDFAWAQKFKGLVDACKHEQLVLFGKFNHL